MALDNGVGILPDGKVVFAMSKTEVNFYNFADYFKKLGCKNALYLDGFVSRTYLPEQDGGASFAISDPEHDFWNPCHNGTKPNIREPKLKS